MKPEEELEACFTLFTSYPGILVPPGWLNPLWGNVDNQSKQAFKYVDGKMMCTRYQSCEEVGMLC